MNEITNNLNLTVVHGSDIVTCVRYRYCYVLDNIDVIVIASSISYTHPEAMTREFIIDPSA
jgi:hypothetical protein